MVFLDKTEIIIPGFDIESLVQVLKELNKYPTFLIPGLSITNFLGSLFLIVWKVLIADKVVKVRREGDFEESFENRVSVVGKTP